MKIIVIGANHAGTSFMRTLQTLTKENEVITYDRNTDISFLGCGIALWVGNEFEDPAGLFYSSPKQLTNMGIKVNLEHEVTKVDRHKKKIWVKNLKTNEEFTDTYDKLIYAAGTWPILPSLPGINYENILISKIFSHAKIIKQKAMDPNIKNVTIVGAGYIGIELAEAFHKYNKKVTLIDMQDRIIPNYFDHQFTSKLENKMIQEGINLRLEEKISHFESDDQKKVSKIVTDKNSYPTDLVIMSIGFKTNSSLLEDVAKIGNGAIKVDQFQRSISDPDIYVLGDVASMMHNSDEKYGYVALATNAVKTGIVAATNIVGKQFAFPGYQGTNAISVFGFNLASTGYSSEGCKKFYQGKFAREYFEDYDRPEFMQHKQKVWIKITYCPETLRLLGAQIGSENPANHTEAIYMLSLAIQQKMTIAEVALADFYFLPHFNKPFNFIIQVCLNALGLKYPHLKPEEK